MWEWMKLAGLSAALSASLVAALQDPGGPDPGARTAGKAHFDRVPQADGEAQPRAVAATGRGAPAVTRGSKGDRQQPASGACAAWAWPNVPSECLAPADGTPARKMVRTITIERREGDDTSILVRMPQTAVAAMESSQDPAPRR